MIMESSDLGELAECGKRYCSVYRSVNPKIRDEHCFSERAKSCLHARGDGEFGMFYSPDGGEHYMSEER